MKTWKVEKNQEFECLTKFMSRELLRECIDQLKYSIFKEKSYHCNQDHLEKNLKFCSYNTLASQHMIKIEINQIMKFDKRFSTLQKRVKLKAYCKRYCSLKFFAHQIQRNEMFFVFAAFMFDKFENEIWNDFLFWGSHSK